MSYQVRDSIAIVKPVRQVLLLQRFEHEDYSIWNDEYFGHDITVARKHGTNRFEVWIDDDLVSVQPSLPEAEKFVIHCV